MSDIGNGIDKDKPVKEQWDDQKFRNDVGINIDVERSAQHDEIAHRANRALNDIGDFIHQNTDSVKQLQYIGSAAVHIYLAPTVGECEYITQTYPLRETAERMAGPAFTQLQKDMMVAYRRKTTKIRSGF